MKKIVIFTLSTVLFSSLIYASYVFSDEWYERLETSGRDYNETIDKVSVSGASGADDASRDVELSGVSIEEEVRFDLGDRGPEAQDGVMGTLTGQEEEGGIVGP